MKKVSSIIDFPCPIRAYCFVLPTGAGKSIIIAASIKEFQLVYDSPEILVCSWSRTIIAQDLEKSEILGCDLSHTDFVTVQSMKTKCKDKVYDIIIVDECHKMYEGTSGYESITSSMQNSNGSIRNPKSETYVLGFTATPYRNKHENVINEEMFVGVDDVVGYNELIKDGYLSQPEYIKSQLFCYDRKGLEDNGFDFSSESMERQCKKAISAIASLIKECDSKYSQKIVNPCTLVFLPSIRIMKEVEEKLNKMKISCECIQGSTEEDDRKEIISSSRIILNCMTMTTGVDITRISNVIICRATKSWVLWKQMVGRGLRTSKGKDYCAIIDCGGNTEIFGDDLDDMPSTSDKTTKGLPVMTECPKCHAYVHVSKKVCRCGFVLRTDDEIHAAKLSKIYYDGGMRPVKSYKIKTVNIPRKGKRTVVEVSQLFGTKHQMYFSEHPYSQERLKEYKKLLKESDDNKNILYVRFEKQNGFENIVSAKITENFTGKPISEM